MEDKCNYKGVYFVIFWDLRSTWKINALIKKYSSFKDPQKNITIHLAGIAPQCSPWAVYVCITEL